MASKVLENNLAEKSLSEASQAARITELVNQSIDQTRSMAKGLCAVDLSDGSLDNALGTLAENTCKLFGVNCTFEAAGSVNIDDSFKKIQLYRIAQESVSNAIKHGKANNISIILSAIGGVCELKIENDGLPFSGRVGADKGIGLQIMQHRANAIGAQLYIMPKQTGWTEVVCRF